MNILIIHEIDWFKKVIFEPHHLAEIFSKENNVYVIDCPQPNSKKFFQGLKTRVMPNVDLIYKDASITVIHPPSILIKGFNRLTNYLSCKKTIDETTLQHKIDIILLYGVATNGIQTLEIAKKYGIPIIYRALDIGHGLVKIPIISKITKQYEQKVIQNATKVMPTTLGLCRFAERMGGDKNKIEMFPLGINTIEFKPQKKSEDLMKKLGISNDEKIIVFVGTLYEFSGLLEIVKKFKQNIAKNSKIKFLIVGGGPIFSKLKREIKSKNLEKNFIMTNFVPQKEIPEYISLADLCINSFDVNYITDDILPTKVLEYLACKKPVLSTPLSGTKELLPGESHGVVFSQSEIFLQNIERLLENESKLEKLAENGYNYVINNHDWQQLSKNMIKTFQELLK